jgi:hypothetical protein
VLSLYQFSEDEQVNEMCLKKVFCILLPSLEARRQTATKAEYVCVATKEEDMFRRGVALVLPILLAMAVVVPVTARAASTNNRTSVNASMGLLAPLMLGGKSLKPGNYAVSADDTKVTFKSNGKMVAEAAIQWKDSATQSKSDNVVAEGNQIREIHFRGKTRYAQVTE